LAHQETALVLGKALTPGTLHDDTVGRVMDLLDDTGTMKVLTAGAVRADQVFGWDNRSVHFDTTSVSVSGEYRPPEDQQEHEVPCTMTHGESQAKRPDLTQCVRSTLGVERAGPLWGKPEDGKASDNTVHNPLWSDSATFLAQHGVAPGAYIDVADAALVTEDHLAALGDTLCMRRVPATENACGRLLAAAVAQNTWKAVGILADPKPTQHRPATS